MLSHYIFYGLRGIGDTADNHIDSRTKAIADFKRAKFDDFIDEPALAIGNKALFAGLFCKSDKFIESNRFRFAGLPQGDSQDGFDYEKFKGDDYGHKDSEAEIRGQRRQQARDSGIKKGD
jgi:hypothetical protein